MTTTSTTTATEPWRQNLGRFDDARLLGLRGDWWWTGQRPELCRGFRPDGTLGGLPQLNLETCTREEVLAYFDTSWTLTEVLFASLAAEEAFYRPPAHGLRHPMIFYYGHPVSVYVNKLRVAGVLDSPVNSHLEMLFETGVDEMSWDDMSKNEEAWPSIQEAHDYRAQVYGIIRKLIAEHPDLKPGATFADGSLLWALAMGFEHEHIHLETSAVLIRELPLELVQRPAHWPKDHPSAEATLITPMPPAVSNPLVSLAGGEVHLGKPNGFPSFGWDNAYGADIRSVAPFAASETLVSHAEFHAFVAEGGYRDARYWTETGWSWRAFRNVKWPHFWVPDGPAGSHRYRLRLPFAEVPMPWSWPVEVNWHEARAFAAWRSEKDRTAYRLPTEAEHHLMRPRATGLAADNPANDPAMAYGAVEMAAAGLNLNLAYGSPMPVTAGSKTAQGLYQPIGNVWSWLEDDFHPLPGNQLDPFYDDFSAPCYDGEHQMIGGGSFVSLGELASHWARYHFRPHFHQFAGIRLVEGPEGTAVKIGKRGEALASLAPPDSANPYEARRMVDEYMLMHHGAPEDVMPWPNGPTDGLDFAGRCGRLLVAACEEAGTPMGRALDLGCAVGGASFAMAKRFGEVVGVDWSQAFVDAAEALRRHGKASYFRRDEGELGETREVVLDAAIDVSRLHFERGDAMSPPAHWQPFDGLLLANLVDRLRDPAACLARLSALVKPDGIVVITTPYTWLEEYTPKTDWLGGTERNGQPMRGFEGLKAMMSASFVFVGERDMPFVIREHARKFQWSMAHATIWQRK